MSAKKREMPDSFVDEATGVLLTRDIRPFTVRYKGESMTVDLPGYYPEGEGESVHIGDDMIASDEALRAIKRRLGEMASSEDDAPASRLAS